MIIGGGQHTALNDHFGQIFETGSATNRTHAPDEQVKRGAGNDGRTRLEAGPA